MQSGEKIAPVIIVGAGPVGMNMALNLATLGVHSVLVNAAPDTRWLPKGNTHNARTMENYRRLGIAARLRRLGLPADHPTDVGYFTSLNGWEVARLAMLSETAKLQQRKQASVTDQVPEPMFRCNQMYVERELYAHLKTLKSVGLRFGWRCTDFKQDGDGVDVTIEETETGRREVLRGAYLVGCDGGPSVVRRGLEIRYSGDIPVEQAYGSGPMLSTHLRAPALYERVISRRCWQYWLVSSRGRGLLTPLNGKDEFTFEMRVNALDDKPDTKMVASRFLTAVGQDIPFEFIAHWPWTAGQALVADRFGKGRVLLAGDSAHLFTPTGGFGMNTGVDDAANLAWKLAAVVQGWGGPNLIATYEAERRPIAFRNTAHARRWARSQMDVPISPAMDEAGEAGDLARAATGSVLSRFGEQFASIGVQLGARYDGSIIVEPDGATPPPDDPETFRPSACPGGRAPHVWLPDGTSLFDHFGNYFTLLRLPGSRDSGEGFVAAAQRRNIPLKVLDVAVPEARDLYETQLALVRPDQYVAWRGDRTPDSPDVVLARVTGW